MSPAGALSVTVAGLTFQNPVVLAAGTAGYGLELAGVTDLARIGGFVTKAVSVEPRQGNPAVRVAELRGGMLNAVGLANPGLDAVQARYLPWLASHFPGTRKLVNVVGREIQDFARVVESLDAATGAWSPGATDSGGIDGFELNVSCPNVKAGGMEFGADPECLRQVVEGARRVTRRPLFVKLSPALPDVSTTARVAVDAGADALTLVNTLPGLSIDVERRRPRLSFGSGGVSGGALLPSGVLATWKVSRAVSVPIMGVGGISTAEDAVQYILAGASLVGVGTAGMRDPRAPERIVRGLERWCDRHDVPALSDLVGALEWPA